jgi:poly-gamma-glutamate capsule biosynthesis protein CapA/YwtB (metallophosphatase superfamily)
VQSAGGDAPRRGARLVTGLVAVVSVALVVAGLATVARSIQPAARPTLAPSASTARSTAGGIDPTGTPSPTPAPQITLAFAGDVHFEGRVADRLAEDPVTTLGPVAAVLSRADLAMVNLETAITERGAAEPKQFTFRAPATAFAALKAAGVDVVTMANNHGVDFGPTGLTDTVAAIAGSRFPTVGIGPDAARAYAPHYRDVRGHRVAVLGASQIRDHTLAVWTAGPDSPGIASAYSDRLVTAVRDARRRAEIVVVYLHWGIEGQGCPSAEQKALAARLAEAGADAVVGTHAHLLLGGGWLDRTYVAYGLGNFLWWRDGAYSNDTGVLQLTFRGRRVVESELTPARIDGRGVPVPATGGTAARIQRNWTDLRGCTDLAAAP